MTATPPDDGSTTGIMSSLEMEDATPSSPPRTSRGGGLVSNLIQMLIPTSPHVEHRHLPLDQDDNDHDGLHELREVSDHFELDDIDNDDDECHDQPQVDSHGLAAGTASPAQVAVNIFISFVGAGLLGLPYAFSRSGWALGTAALALVSSGNLYCMLLLVKIRKRLESNGITGIKGYGCIGREVIGGRGELLVNVCLVVSQAGFATAYLIFIAANVRSAVMTRSGNDVSVGRAAIIYGCVPILSLIVQFRDMKKLSPFSLIADGKK